MIVPAVLYKEEIEKEFQKLAFTDRLMFYDGSIENAPHEINLQADWYNQAIINEEKELIGYLSYRVDWYAKTVYNFGLINFKGGPAKTITNAVREVIKQILSYKPHRIDFRCVGSNPAKKRYIKICKFIENNYNFKFNYLPMTDAIRTRQGNWVDCIVFELITKEKE